MPLSDRERQMLEEIERGLHASDPRLVAKLRDEKRAPRPTSWVLVGALVLAGLAILVLSVATATQLGGVGAAVLGALGFGVMMSAVYLASRAYGSQSSAPTPGAGTRPSAPGAKPSLAKRLEARWEKRFEERGR